MALLLYFCFTIKIAYYNVVVNYFSVNKKQKFNKTYIIKEKKQNHWQQITEDFSKI